MEQVGPVSKSSSFIIFKHFRLDQSGDLHHYRRGKDRETHLPLTPWTPKERGGMTICYIRENGELVGMGMAHCSLKDQFCYRLGRDISKGRALKSVPEYKVLKSMQGQELSKTEGV